MGIVSVGTAGFNSPSKGHDWRLFIMRQRAEQYFASFRLATNSLPHISQTLITVIIDMALALRDLLALIHPSAQPIDLAEWDFGHR